MSSYEAYVALKGSLAGKSVAMVRAEFASIFARQNRDAVADVMERMGRRPSSSKKAMLVELLQSLEGICVSLMRAEIIGRC
jgi:hypothetical protein